MNRLQLPPKGAVGRPPTAPERGQVACWWSNREHLDDGFLSVALAEAAVIGAGVELPRRVEVLAGLRWTHSAQLRRAALMLNHAANWLDADVDHGRQLMLPIEATL